MTVAEAARRDRLRAGPLHTGASTVVSVLTLTALGIMVWGSTARLSGAVVAPARVAVETNLKRVQAAVTGPLVALHVRPSERVEAGQLLLTIEGGQARAALDIIVTQQAATRAQLDRLLGERDNARRVRWSEVALADAALVRRAIAAEQLQFDLRLAQHESARSRLKERRDQLEDDATTLRRQLALREREERLLRQEFDLITNLRRRQLTPVTRYIGIQRDVARFESDIAALRSQLTRIGSQIRDIDFQLAVLDQTRAAEAQRDATAAELKLVELAERRLAAEEQVRALELRAPVAGVVHDLTGTVQGPSCALAKRPWSSCRTANHWSRSCRSARRTSTR